MKRNLLGCLTAIALSASLGAATPTMAFHGGGFGGMHGGGFGGGFGGMHGGGFGGMHAGGFGGGFRGGMPAVGGFHGGMPARGGMIVHNGGFASRAAFAPIGNRFVGNRFVGGRFAFANNRFAFHNRFAFRNRFFFHNRRFNNFAFFGAPFVAYAGSYYYDDYCWRRVWTYYGWRWAYTCGYGY